MVHLEHSFAHREVAHTVLQLLIEHHATAVHVLIVHTHRQHKVKKLTLRHLRSPRHLTTGLEGIIHILQKKLCRIICHIGQRHVSIKKLHGTQTVARQSLIEDAEIAFVSERSTPSLKVGDNLIVGAGLHLQSGCRKKPCHHGPGEENQWVFHNS